MALAIVQTDTANQNNTTLTVSISAGTPSQYNYYIVGICYDCTATVTVSFQTGWSQVATASTTASGTQNETLLIAEHRAGSGETQSQNIVQLSAAQNIRAVSVAYRISGFASTQETSSIVEYKKIEANDNRIKTIDFSLPSGSSDRIVAAFAGWNGNYTAGTGYTWSGISGTQTDINSGGGTNLEGVRVYGSALVGTSLNPASGSASVTAHDGSDNARIPNGAIGVVSLSVPVTSKGGMLLRGVGT